MAKRGIRLLTLLAALFVLALVFVSPSRAQVQPVTGCSSYQKDPKTGQKVFVGGYVGLTNHIAGCIRDTLDSATDRFFDSDTGFYPLVSRAISAMMVLAVIVTGIMASYGMLEKLGRDSIMLLLKVAMVGYFAANSDLMYHKVIDMMDGTAQSVVKYVPSSGNYDPNGGNYSQISCLENMTESQQAMNDGSTAAKGVVGPWLAMDCMIDSVIGIKIEPKGGVAPNAMSQARAYNKKLKDDEKGLSRGLLYMFFSSYQTSVMGAILAVIGFIFLWGMINLIIKALFIYIAGYIGLTVMMMVAPIFVPMVLFQQTKSYFDKWIKLVISFALQPIIILVFVTLSVAAVDLATFSGSYSVMHRIAGDAADKQGFSLNTYLTCLRDKTNPGTCINQNPMPKYDPDKHVMIINKAAWDVLHTKGDSKDTTPLDKTEAGGVLNNLDVSKCTTALTSKPDKDLTQEEKKIKAECSQSYPLQLWHNTINWDVAAQARSPVVIQGNAKTLGQAISREVMAAVIFAAIVVSVMNGLLKVIPMVAYDLIGDFGQSPNLGGVGGVMPGQRGLRAQLQGMVTRRGGGS